MSKLYALNVPFSLILFSLSYSNLSRIWPTFSHVSPCLFLPKSWSCIQNPVIYCYNNIFIYSKKGRHICDGSSKFHVYSKKGWVSFCPDKDVLIITVGDQTQVLQKLLKKSRIITLGFLFSTTSICLS